MLCSVRAARLNVLWSLGEAFIDERHDCSGHQTSADEHTVPSKDRNRGGSRFPQLSGDYQGWRFAVLDCLFQYALRGIPDWGNC